MRSRSTRMNAATMSTRNRRADSSDDGGDELLPVFERAPALPFRRLQAL